MKHEESKRYRLVDSKVYRHVNKTLGRAEEGKCSGTMVENASILQKEIAENEGNGVAQEKL